MSAAAVKHCSDCVWQTFYSASAHYTDFFVYLILLLESFIMKVETHFGI